MLDTISMADKLKGDYRKVFEKADMYGSVAGVEEEIQDEKMMNLYDSLIQAQHEEKPVEKIIGNDIEEFCRDYFNIEEESKEKWYIRIPKTIYNIMKVLIICTILWLMPFDDLDSILETKQDISPFFTGILFGIVTIFFYQGLKKFIFKSKKIKPLLFYFIILLEFIVGVVISVWVSSFYQVEVSNKVLISMSVGYVVVYLLVRSIWRYLKFGTIRKETKEASKHRKDEKRQMKSFNKELSDDSTYKIMVNGMAKRYARLQRKKEMTFPEFAAKIRKEDKQTRKLNVIILFVYVAIIIVPAVLEMINNNIFEGFILGLILAAVEIPIYRFFIKTGNKNCDISVQIIEDCEKKGLDLIEYAKELKEN